MGIFSYVMEKIKKDGFDEQPLKDIPVKITEVHVFSLKEGGYAINAEINGVKQESIKLKKEEVKAYFDEKSISYTALASKVYEVPQKIEGILNTLNEIKLKNKETIALELLNSERSKGLVKLNIEVLSEEMKTEGQLILKKDEQELYHVIPQLLRTDLSQELDRTFFGHTFTDDQKRKLLEVGNAGEVIDIRLSNGIPTKVLVSVNPITNTVVAQSVDKIFLLGAFRGVAFSEEQIGQLKDGQACFVEGIKSKDDIEYALQVQYNVALKKMEVLQNTTFIQSVRGKVLDDVQREKIEKGEELLLSGLFDKEGERYSAYVKVDINKLKTGDITLDMVKADVQRTAQVNPTNEFSVQVEHNNQGVKREENKKQTATNCIASGQVVKEVAKKRLKR